MKRRLPCSWRLAAALFGLACAPACGERPSEGGAGHYNAALLAWEAGRFEEAVQHARAAEAANDSLARRRAAYVRGLVSFAWSEESAAEAARPGGDRTARERAIADAEDALLAWRVAATGADDWPAARRNVERALLRLEELSEVRRDRKPRPPRPPPPRRPVADPTPPVPPAGTVAEDLLSADQTALLFERLAEKDAEKRQVRRAAQALVEPAGVADR